MLVTAFGESRTLRDWLNHPKCAVSNESTIRNRLWKGWTAEAAISRPVQQTTKPVMLTAFGKTQSLSAWANDPQCTVTAGALQYRLAHGMTPEQAITTPKRSGRGTAGHIEAWGQRRTITEWANDPRCTVSPATVQSRLSRRWDSERAIGQSAPATLRGTLLTIDGETKELREWVRSPRCTVSFGTVRRRLKDGMDPKVAVTAPPSRQPATSHRPPYQTRTENANNSNGNARDQRQDAPNPRADDCLYTGTAAPRRSGCGGHPL